MVTLALDTSHPVGSVALARAGVLLGAETFREPSSHLVALEQCVDRVLTAAGLAVTGIERVAVVTGPGSFTGLRIGLSFAKGLHAATGVPLVAMNALQLLALAHFAHANRVCGMIDARRGEVYAAVYERTGDAFTAREIVAPLAVSAPAWLSTLDVPPDVFAGTGAHAHRERIHADFPRATIATDLYPSTTHLAVIAHGLHALGESEVRTLEPLYVRESGAAQKRLRAHAHPAEGGDG